MSSKNGDKSRFHRERKQKIARRKRSVELQERLSKAAKSEGSSTGVPPKSVTA